MLTLVETIFQLTSIDDIFCLISTKFFPDVSLCFFQPMSTKNIFWSWLARFFMSMSIFFFCGHQLGFFGWNRLNFFFFWLSLLGFIVDISHALFLHVLTKVFFFYRRQLRLFLGRHQPWLCYWLMSTTFFFLALVRTTFCLHQLGFLWSTSTKATLLPASTDDDFWHISAMTIFLPISARFFGSTLTKVIFWLMSTRVISIDCQMRKFFDWHRLGFFRRC